MLQVPQSRTLVSVGVSEGTIGDSILLSGVPKVIKLVKTRYFFRNDLHFDHIFGNVL